MTGEVLFLPRLDQAELPKTDVDLGERTEVRKLTLGELDNAENLVGLARIHRWPPNLERLHVWTALDLEQIPEQWPPQLKTLDLRGCPKLKRLPPLPPGLQLLDLGGATALEDLTLPAEGFPHLEKLFLTQCMSLAPVVFLRALRAGPNLHEFDFSSSSVPSEIGILPGSLFRIRLRKAPSFQRFTFPLPANLLTLDLNGCGSLNELPQLPKALNFLDLRECAALRALPEPPGIGEDFLANLLTLYLAGSGVGNPPREIHGEADENRAEQVRGFFQEKRKRGSVERSRCKLLLLGNGYSGKTTLAKLLKYRQSGDPRHRPRVEEKTTHGIQFFDLREELVINGALASTSIHVWDFGGQDLYRNTHRVFIKAGSIFLLVWNPDEGPTLPNSSVPDVNQPISFWIDSVRSLRPDARIAVVCTRRGGLESWPPNKRQPTYWMADVREDQRTDIETFHVNSIGDGDGRGTGQIDALTRWIQDSATTLLNWERGPILKSWEVAMGMVEEWLARNTAAEDRSDPPAVKTVDFDEFHRQLQNRWTAIDPTGPPITSDAVEACLEYLSNTGLLFWRRELPNRVVVIGQKWALDGIYSLLARPDAPEPNPTYEKLAEAGGRFQPGDLAEWAWNKMGYTPAEQELLLGMMEACGLCFKTVDRVNSWYDRHVYVSVTHLPRAIESSLSGAWHRHAGVVGTIEVSSPWFHSGIWNDLMEREGTRARAAGRYAADAFLIPSDDGGALFATYQHDESVREYPLQGLTRLETKGPIAWAQAKECAQWIAGRCRDVAMRELEVPAGFEDDRLVEASRERPSDKRRTRPAVLISYARSDGDHHGIVAPLDDLVRSLPPSDVDWHYDTKDAPKDVHAFVQEFGRSGYYFVIIHSRRYWKRPYCMWEMATIRNTCEDQDEKLRDRVIPIRVDYDPGSQMFVEELEQHWSGLKEEDFQRLPDRASATITREECLTNVRRFPKCFRSWTLSGGGRWDIVYDRREPEKMIREVRRRLRIDS